MSDPPSSNTYSLGEPWRVVDPDGVVHVARKWRHPIYGGYGNVDEEEINLTDCEYEPGTYWPRPTDSPVTCLACLGLR